MNTTSSRPGLRRALVCAALVAAGPAIGHEGEDHSAPAAVIGQTLLPRAATATEAFELVAVLEIDRLLIYVDRHASNEPVPAAKVEVEGGGLNGAAKEVAPGLYAVALSTPMPAGRHALTVSIEAGSNADLLSVTLDVPAPPALPAPTGADLSLSRLSGSPYAWLGGGAALLLAGLALGARRRRQRASTL